MFNKIYDLVFDIVDFVKYDILHSKPPIIEFPFKKEINFTGYKEDDGGVWVESDELPNFYAVAKNEQELTKEIFNTLLTYYDVPRYFAKKISPQGTLQLPDGRIINLVSEGQLKYQFK